MTETVDYVVIGSGSAGSVIATRLAEDPDCRILVLEAGGTDQKYFYRRPGALGLVYQVPQLKAAADWGYKTEPLTAMDGREMPYTRGRIVGGCSTVNGMLYVRGHRSDYDRWATEHGCEGWSYEDLLPLFKRSETHQDGASEFHGGEGPLQVTRQTHISPVSEAWVEAASRVTGVPVVQDFNGARQEGVGIYHQTASKRRRSSASVAFLHPAIERSSNLALRTGCLVTKLIVEGGRVVGVRYRHEGEEKVVHVTAEVVLCAGAIGSPQILMLSGIGPADHLTAVGVDVVHDLPGVGENFHDHLYTPLRYLARETGHSSTAPHFLWGMFRDYLLDSGWFGDTFLEGGGFIKSSAALSCPDMQFLTIPWAYPEPNDDHLTNGVISKKPSFTVMPILLRPKSRGTLRLKSADPASHPAIDPGFLEDPRDMEILVHGVQLTREISCAKPLLQYMKGEAFPGPDCHTDAQIRAHIRQASKTVYHPVGSCRMGTGADAVVDPHCRLHGLSGLRVADASIMPEIVGGNTNAPTIAIGERAADLIREQ